MDELIARINEKLAKVPMFWEETNDKNLHIIIRFIKSAFYAAAYYTGIKEKCETRFREVVFLVSGIFLVFSGIAPDAYDVLQGYTSGQRGTCWH